jgi:hypothetical protein
LYIVHKYIYATFYARTKIGFNTKCTQTCPHIDTVVQTLHRYASLYFELNTAGTYICICGLCSGDALHFGLSSSLEIIITSSGIYVQCFD